MRMQWNFSLTEIGSRKPNVRIKLSPQISGSFPFIYFVKKGGQENNVFVNITVSMERTKLLIAWDECDFRVNVSSSFWKEPLGVDLFFPQLLIPCLMFLNLINQIFYSTILIKNFIGSLFFFFFGMHTFFSY